MANDFKPRYVWRRGDSWQYRRRVPDDVRETIGKVNWYFTWPPGAKLSQIEDDAARLNRKHDIEVRVARGEAETAEIAKAEQQAKDFLSRQRYEDLAFIADNPTPADSYFLAAIESGGRYQKPITLTEALRLDQERHSADRDPRPFHYAVESFKVAVGDLDITRIRRSDVAAWINAERKRVKASTVRRRLDSLAAMVGRIYRDMDVGLANPFERHDIRGGRGSPHDKVPFHKSHLDLIDRYFATATRLDPSTKNMLQIMRYTGGGPAEVSGLETADVVLSGPVPFVWYRPNCVRSLKVEVRQRQVPLLAGGLEAAQDALRRATGNTLFEGYDPHGRKADHVSARLNACLRRAGIPRTPRLTCYSFRHGITEGLRAASVHPDLSRRLLGHSAPDIHSGRYGATAAQLVEAQQAVQKAIERLGQIDLSVYRAGELG